MQIDLVSQQLIKVALFLEKQHPGSVSEIWLDKNLIKKLKQNLPHKNEIKALIENTQNLIFKLQDQARKKFLLETLHSLKFQIFEKYNYYPEFSYHVFGYKIKRVNQKEIDNIQAQIQNLEQKFNKSCFEVFKTQKVATGQVLTVLKQKNKFIKKQIPKFLTNIKNSDFSFEAVKNKPWSAFNQHLAPFKSKLLINIDIPFHTNDLFRLAAHEGWAGHHAELSLKDKKLIQEGKGEHALVITYSPQSFISEGLAEVMFDILNLRDSKDHLMMLAFYYDRLMFALQNLATFMFFDDKLNKSQIKSKLKKYHINQTTLDIIVNFSTDKIFGKYAPVYYSAYNFILDKYQQSKNKKFFIQKLFTQPNTISTL